jgi:ADP-heptose:LPS heptosyltransferase
MGDTVLSGGIANALAIEEGSYVVSNYPELFIGHPTVHGVRSYEELPPHAKIIDITKSIKSIEGKGIDKHVVTEKYLNMAKEAGFQRAVDPPKLYLTAAEWGSAQEMRHFFPNKPNIGVVLGSAHIAKNWVHMVKGIKRLHEDGFNVFVFADKLNKGTDWTLPNGIYYVIGRTLRQMMQYIAMMDVMMGVDTGPMHVAGALGVPLVVICFKVFADLYTMYEPAIILDSNNFTLSKGIQGVSVKQMRDAIAEIINDRKRKAPIIDVGELEIMQAMNHAYIRLRGVGDVGLLLPAVATARSKNGNSAHTYTLITSHAGKVLAEGTDLFDEVIEVKYDHPHSGFPLPPPGLDYSKWDSVANLINAIDFVPHSDSVPRTELFARAIGLEKCDYTSPGWKLKAPTAWKDAAWNVLNRNGVEEGDKILAFQIDTKGASRIWHKARQVNFCGMALKKGWKVVLISDMSRSKYPKACINTTGQLSMEEYFGMIAIATVCLSPDSAMIHIAGMIDKDAIGLFGPVDPGLRIAHYETVHAIVGKHKYCTKGGKFTPCNDWQLKSCAHMNKPPLCMWNIRAKDVLDKVEEVYKAKHQFMEEV